MPKRISPDGKPKRRPSSAYRKHRVYGGKTLATYSRSDSAADKAHTNTDARITELLTRRAPRKIIKGEIPLQTRSIQRGPGDNITIWTENRPEFRLDRVMAKAKPHERRQIFEKTMRGIANMHAFGRVANRDLRGTTPNIFVYPRSEGERPSEPRFTDFGWGVTLPMGERLGHFDNTRETMLTDVDDAVELFRTHLHSPDLREGLEKYNRQLRKSLAEARAPFKYADLKIEPHLDLENVNKRIKERERL
jgi:hypothetical protein